MLVALLALLAVSGATELAGGSPEVDTSASMSASMDLTSSSDDEGGVQTSDGSGSEESTDASETLPYTSLPQPKQLGKARPNFGKVRLFFFSGRGVVLTVFLTPISRRASSP